MKISNEALFEKSFMEKSITTENLPNGNYKISANEKPNKGKEKLIEMEFTKNGLNALIGSLMMFGAER